MKDKLGINIETVETNIGSFPTFTRAMTPAQRNAMQSYVDRGYEIFVKRCADGRGMTIDQIKAIAEGRVWDGTSALENGLVDKLGGLQTAINDMAIRLGTNIENIDIEEYPKFEPQWWEKLAAMEQGGMISLLTSKGDFTIEAYKYITNRIRNIYPIQCRADYILLK